MASKRVVALAALAMFEVASADDAALRFEQAWVRAAPPGAMMLAAYGHLYNDSAETVTLDGARAAGFGLAEVHRTVEVDGVARMREATPLPIAPGSSVELLPGGLHVMLMRPSAPVSEGGSVSIELLFADGRVLTISAPVRRQPPAPP